MEVPETPATGLTGKVRRHPAEFLPERQSVNQ
jgi:hypothetical protein